MESCHVDMVPSCSANPFVPRKDKNEDEQEDFTGLKYFKIPVEILCTILQSRVIFATLLVCCSKLLEG